MRTIIKAKGVRWVPDDGNDPNWRRLPDGTASAIIEAGIRLVAEIMVRRAVRIIALQIVREQQWEYFTDCQRRPTQ